MTPAALLLLLAHLKTAPGAEVRVMPDLAPAPAPIRNAEDFARAFDVSRETLV